MYLVCKVTAVETRAIGTFREIGARNGFHFSSGGALSMDLDHILDHLGEDRDVDARRGAAGVPKRELQLPHGGRHARETVQQEFDRPVHPWLQPDGGHARKGGRLEGAEDALVFSSGSAAIAAAVIAFVQAGDHVVCVRKPYSWTRKLLDELLARFGVEVTCVDGTDAENYRRACRDNTRLFILESPNSLTFELQDLGAGYRSRRSRACSPSATTASTARSSSGRSEHGIDLVAHSATKYPERPQRRGGGRAGGIAGAHPAGDGEGVHDPGRRPPPHDAWLLMRGLRTLGLRMHRSADSAARVTTSWKRIPRWPACVARAEGHPQHALASRQMERGPA